MYCFMIIILFTWLNSSIWSVDETQKGTTTSCQSGPGSNENEEVLYILKASELEPHH